MVQCPILLFCHYVDPYFLLQTPPLLPQHVFWQFAKLPVCFDVFLNTSNASIFHDFSSFSFSSGAHLRIFCAPFMIYMFLAKTAQQRTTLASFRNAGESHSLMKTWFCLNPNSVVAVHMRSPFASGFLENMEYGFTDERRFIVTK